MSVVITQTYAYRYERGMPPLKISATVEYVHGVPSNLIEVSIGTVTVKDITTLSSFMRMTLLKVIPLEWRKLLNIKVGDLSIGDKCYLILKNDNHEPQAVLTAVVNRIGRDNKSILARIDDEFDIWFIFPENERTFTVGETPYVTELVSFDDVPDIPIEILNKTISEWSLFTAHTSGFEYSEARNKSLKATINLVRYVGERKSCN